MNINDMIEAQAMDRAINKMQRSVKADTEAKKLHLDSGTLVKVMEIEEHNAFLLKTIPDPLDVTGFSAERLSTVGRKMKVTKEGNRLMMEGKLERISKKTQEQICVQCRSNHKGTCPFCKALNNPQPICIAAPLLELMHADIVHAQIYGRIGKLVTAERCKACDPTTWRIMFARAFCERIGYGGGPAANKKFMQEYSSVLEKGEKAADAMKAEWMDMSADPDYTMQIGITLLALLMDDKMVKTNANSILTSASTGTNIHLCFNPKENAELSGGGDDGGIPLYKFLASGRHFILRELVRLKVIDNPAIHQYCYVPKHHICERFGLPEKDARGRGIPNLQKSINICGKVRQLFPENPTLNGLFDLALTNYFNSAIPAKGYED
jgi:hypothetical protein